MERIGLWTKTLSKSSGKYYWFNAQSKQSVWADDKLPYGWAWAKEKEDAPVFWVNLFTGARSSILPTDAAPRDTHAEPSALASRPDAASQLSFRASQTAGDDLVSTAYIPDASAHGLNVPENIRSKRDYLLGYTVPEADRWKLQVDEVALYSITEGRQAEKMTEYIVQALSSSTNMILQFVITDATAAVGGNTLSFARSPAVARVYAIELSPQRARMCAHNAGVAGVDSKVVVRCGDAVSTVSAPTWVIGPSHCVFMDPPWGGPEYAKAASLDMFLGTVDVADWTVALTGGDKSLPGKHVRTLVVAIKAPLNFNVQGLRTKLQAAGTGAVLKDVFIMHKMQLLLVHAAPGSVLHVPAQNPSSGSGAAIGSGKRPRPSDTMEGAASGSETASPDATSHSKGRKIDAASHGSVSVGFELLASGEVGVGQLAGIGPTALFLQRAMQAGGSTLPRHTYSLHAGPHFMHAGARTESHARDVLFLSSSDDAHAEEEEGLITHLVQGALVLQAAKHGAAASFLLPPHAHHDTPPHTPLHWGPQGVSAATWTLHVDGDVERMMTQVQGTALARGVESLLRALHLPVLQDCAVAGEGKRGRVIRGLFNDKGSERTMVVKVQPWDERVAQEKALTVVLLAAVERMRAQGSDVLCLPTAIIRDRGPWPARNGAPVPRCIQVMQDAGTAVEALVQPGTGLPPVIVLAILRRILHGLVVMHANALLHADIHAGNVLVPGSHTGTGEGGAPLTRTGITLEQAGRARLIDFGSMRLMNGLAPGGSYNGVSRGGRWDIMAPEQFGPGQWGSGDVSLGVWSDVYAAGATSVHLLLGSPPFAPQAGGGGGGVKLTVNGCLHAPMRSPDALAAALAPILSGHSGQGLDSAQAGSFSRALLRMLAPMPTHRFGSASEAIAALPDYR